MVQAVKIRHLTRATRLLLGVSAFAIILAFILFQFKDLFIFPTEDPYYEAVKRRYVSLIALALGTFGAGGILLLYLRGSMRISILDKYISLDEYTAPEGSANIEIGNLHQRVELLSSEFDRIKILRAESDSGVTAEELASALLPSVKSDLGSIFEAKYADEAINSRAAKNIATQFDAAISRLSFELGAQTRRSNLNLVIGVLTTSIAVGLLVYMVFGVAPDLSTWPHIAAHYIPRITIVVFIEIFSFFFLRLYKETLQELRTYHDDLTKLSLQRVAVETAWASKDASDRTSIAKDLLAAAKIRKAERSSERKSEEYKVIEAVLKTVARELAEKVKKSEKNDNDEKDD